MAASPHPRAAGVVAVGGFVTGPRLPRRPRDEVGGFLSPTTIDGAFVCPRMISGNTDASATRSPVTPRTRSSGSTTEPASDPILAVEVGWYSVCESVRSAISSWESESSEPPAGAYVFVPRAEANASWPRIVRAIREAAQHRRDVRGVCEVIRVDHRLRERVRRSGASPSRGSSAAGAPVRSRVRGPAAARGPRRHRRPSEQDLEVRQGEGGVGLHEAVRLGDVRREHALAAQEVFHELADPLRREERPAGGLDRIEGGEVVAEIPTDLRRGDEDRNAVPLQLLRVARCRTA